MNSLRKYIWVVAVSALALAALSLSTQQPSVASAHATRSALSTYYYYDFSTTIKPWLAAVNALEKQTALLERVPNIDGCAPAHEGSGFAKLKMSSALPGGKLPIDPPTYLGTWMLLPLSVTGVNQVTVSYAAANLAQCDTCSPMVYVGENAPTNAGQFAREATALSTKWQDFSYSTTVSSAKQLYVAIGFNSEDASVGFDCVNIQVDSLIRDSLQSATK